MNVVIITQNDVFYLPDSIEHLLKNMPSHSQMVAAIVLDVSPYGKRESFAKKALKSLTIFGLGFFVRYSFQFLLGKLRGRDVLSVLDHHNVPIIEISDSVNSESSLEKIRSYKPDLIVSIAGNQIFKQPLIDLPPRGVLNLHTALLPKYRGLMPTFWVMCHNETHTGVSVFFVDVGIDNGPIIVQHKIAIGDMSQQQLIRKTKRMGMDAINESIDKIHTGDYETLENNADEASYFSFPTHADVKAFRKQGKRFY